MWVGVREERNERIIHPGKSTVSHIISKHKETSINEAQKIVSLLTLLARFAFKKTEKKSVLMCPILRVSKFYIMEFFRCMKIRACIKFRHTNNHFE